MKRLDVFKCEICGNIVELMHVGGGELVCCGQPMKAMKENTVDASREKHVPVIEKVSGGFKIKVGSVPHPMESKHYIQWIEAIAGERVCRYFLKPNEPPEAFFPIPGDTIMAREYCNLHGLWKS